MRSGAMLRPSVRAVRPAGKSTDACTQGSPTFALRCKTSSPLGGRDTLAFDSCPDELLNTAQQLLALVDRISAAGTRPVAAPPAARDIIDSRRREIWNALVPDGAHDLPRLVFAAACRAAGLRWPYEAAMVAALEARNPRAMWFGSGSRLLEHRWRARALDHWRKAYGALDCYQEHRDNSDVFGED